MQINPLLLPLIEKEVRKMLHAKIIVPLKYLDWVANLVPIKKKYGEIRLCVDYPLPKMDYIFQKVVASSILSMINGFSRYDQIVLHLWDHK